VPFDSTPLSPSVALATTDTAPSDTPATSLYESNWQDLMGIVMASKLSQNDTGDSGPRLGELRYSGDWTTNQIVDYSSFFRDETHSTPYDQINDFESNQFYMANGSIRQDYLDYDSSPSPVTATRYYVAVPNQPFIVVRYHVENPGGSSITWNVLDQVHLNNPSRPSGSTVGSYDGTRNALFGDLTSVSGGAVVVGAFQAMDSYQVGNDSDLVAAHSSASAWAQFDASGSLSNNGSLTTADVDLGFQKSLTIAASGSADLYFYISARSSVSSAQAAADTARAHTGVYWFDQAEDAWANWLDDGEQASTTDTGINNAFDINLITIKQMQNPTLGTIPATSNPISYQYGVWARDGSVTAMGLDATGHYDEAEAFWRWLASAQNTDGSFHTKFDLWDGDPISFVEPEHDSLGMFLLGTYRHYLLTNDSGFLDDLYSDIQDSADFLMDNIDSTYGFGPADASIWEEDTEYNTFSQGMYVAGLWGAQRAAIAKSNATDRDNWNGAASTILSALQRSYGWNPTGLWNETGGYYNRAVNSNFTPRTLVDGSSLAPIAWGVIDASSQRAQTTAQVVSSFLTRDTWGISRYSGDPYYNTSPYSPAGDEAGGPEPAWPQLAMYLALDEIYTGQTANAFSRLQWYVSRSGTGYTPPGEAVSYVTESPIVSTMAEPITAAVFLMTTLAYQGDFDPRITPPDQNAGAYKAVTVSSGTTGDWGQYQPIPYFRTGTAASSSGTSMGKIDRLYITNDASNIYIRVDNHSGALSGYNTEPKFALHVYSEDFNHGGGVSSKSTGFYGRTLDRSMQYMIGRWSDSAGYSHFYVNGGNWTWDYNTTSVIAPQWDNTTGRIEAVIPISAVASGGSASMGSWAYMDIALAYHNNTTNTWTDDDLLQVHYRLTSSGTAWLYGNEDGSYIQNATVDKARFAPSETVQASVTMGNRLSTPLTSGTLSLAFTSLGASAGTTQTQSVSLDPGETGTYAFSWTPPTTDYTGYKLDFTLKDSNNNVLDTAATAVDVSSDWARYPRYGFMTNYPVSNLSEGTYRASLLNDYHINGLQFYDWQWMHHVPLAGSVGSPDATWEDVNNRTISGATVTNLIGAAHDFNMVAQNYNLAYGAWSGYGEDGSGVDYHWGMWDNNNCTSQSGFNLPEDWATPRIYWFDPANTGWQDYIFDREDDAMTAYDFDGWHVDSFGDVGTVYDCNGNVLDNADGIADLLDAAKTGLDKRITFNAVANFSTAETLADPLEFNYVEAWERLGQNTYNDLKTIIDSNWSTTDKPTLIAGYLDYEYAKTTTTQQKLFSDPGVRFLDSLLMAAGGGHVELGEGDQMLSNEYFPTLKAAMARTLRDAVGELYDFQVANENLLLDPSLSINTRTITLPSISTSTNGSTGTVWAFSKAKSGYDVLHLLNLLSATSSAWRDEDADMPAPTIQTNFAVKYYYGTGTVSGVKVASPDTGRGAYSTLSYSSGSDGGGNYISFTVPSLQYWDMIVVQVAR
jgi:Glucoamylase and related glycosyl hydrolases